MTTKPNTFRLLRALTRTMGKTVWKIVPINNGGQWLRTCDGNIQCPLEYAATVATGEMHGIGSFNRAADRLGFPDALRDRVMCASDRANPNFPFGNSKSKTHPNLRRILLRAARLKEASL